MIPILSKANSVLIKIPARFFFLVEIGKLILKVIWKAKGPRITQTISKKNKFGGLTLSDYKIFQDLWRGRALAFSLLLHRSSCELVWGRHRAVCLHVALAIGPEHSSVREDGRQGEQCTHQSVCWGHDFCLDLDFFLHCLCLVYNSSINVSL